jgi:predicted PurR-regulated permease PerM
MMHPEKENGLTSGKSGELIAIIVGVVLFLFLIYIILPVLSPFVVFGAFFFLLYPFRQNVYILRLIWLGVTLFTIWLLISLIGVLIPFLIAFLFAYILNPLVNRLEQKNIPRWLSSLIIILISMTVITGFFILAMPVVITQFRGMIDNASIFINSGINEIQKGSLYDTLSKFGIPVESLRASIERELPGRIEIILRSLLEGAFDFISNISVIVTQLLNIIIIPVITFYLLKDFPAMLNNFNAIFPENSRETIVGYFRKIDEVLSDYLRGAIIVAVIQGSVSAIILSILGVKYSLVLGIMTGLLDFIPYVGLVISLCVAVIAAAFSGDPVTSKIIGVVILYLSQKIFENTILAPKIIGEKVGLHPVLLIASLFIFGHFLGFVGLLLAVPATAVIVMFVKLLQEKKIAVPISRDV